MAHYHLKPDEQRPRHLRVLAIFDTTAQAAYTDVWLPDWRPGRYELGNFARNVVAVSPRNTEGEPLRYQKLNRSCWRVFTKGSVRLHFHYSYFANQTDAGGCYVDEQLFYVNPVHCCVYTEASRSQPCSVLLELEPDFEVATGMTWQDGLYLTTDFDELVDMPILASRNLQHNSFELEGVRYHLWFHGVKEVPWSQLLNDFKAFTRAQLRCMGALPVQQYHYLNLIFPFQWYHGVEHRNSTVIALGPAENVFSGLYNELLGVSSHELFHTWNVKYIKPMAFAPYHYQHENYSELGYVYEGFTTYYGDLMLLRGGVFGWQEYADEVDVYLKRHFDNYGRFNHSLHESSIDTWVDGYGGPAAPHRRVSIYAEGMLHALCLDLELRKSTNNEYSLDTLMRRLYADAIDGLPYDEVRLLELLYEITETSFEPFFETHYHRPASLEILLPQALQWVGCALEKQVSENMLERVYGIRLRAGAESGHVAVVAPGSGAAAAGLVADDVILAQELSETGLHLLWRDKMMHEHQAVINPTGNDFFTTYKLVRLSHFSAQQQAAFAAWINPEPAN
jgi:predicted metalloprotease with PDZ domain